MPCRMIGRQNKRSWLLRIRIIRIDAVVWGRRCMVSSRGQGREPPHKLSAHARKSGNKSGKDKDPDSAGNFRSVFEFLFTHRITA